MKIIEPNVQEVTDFEGVDNFYKATARAARICYASDKTTDDKELCERLIESKHFSPFEHSVIHIPLYGKIRELKNSLQINFEIDYIKQLINRIQESKHTVPTYNSTNMISINGRVIIETILSMYDTKKYFTSNIEALDFALDKLKDYEINPHNFRSFIVDTSIGCTREMNRHHDNFYICEQSTRYCVAGDTILKTTNPHCKLTIRDLYKKFNFGTHQGTRIKIKTLNENTGELFYDTAKNVFYNGEKEVYEITTELGYKLRCTKEHKIYTDKGWKCLEDININNYIYVNGINVETPLYQNREWLYYQNITLNKTFKQIANDFGYNVSTLKKWARNLNLPKKGTGYFNLGRTPWNKGLCEKDSTSVKKQVDSLRKYNNKRKIDTVNYQIYNKGICEICGTKDNLEVHHKDCNRTNNFPSNLITVCESCHQRIHSKNLNIIHLDKVISIKYVGVTDVYDIEMKKNHNYIANGIVVHNCNFSKDKFDGEVAFNKPYWYDKASVKKQNAWEFAMRQAEFNYLDNQKDFTINEIRGVLPLDTHTRAIYTSTVEEWNHIIDLRLKGSTGKPHGDIKIIAEKINKLINDEKD